MVLLVSGWMASKKDGQLQNRNSKLWSKIIMVTKITAESMQEEQLEEIEYVKKKFYNCFKGVKLLQTLVVIICFGVVVQQISSCIRKLIDVPVTTYTHFDFNKTISYPSVTFCREPAYRFNKMLEYNLFSHPRYTLVWSDYNFSISLDDLWEDITYKDEDIFVQFGLDGSTGNVELQSTVGFLYGRCYTLKPKKKGTHASKATGYSITLKHSAEDIATADGLYPPGYHVFVHYTKEPFTEVEVYNGGLVQYLYVSVGETVDLKLTVDEYLKISGEDDPCTFEEDYSANLCTAQYVWDLVGEEAGCSGPWMTSDLPRCSNYTSMRNLIISYMNAYKFHNCVTCPRFCKSYLYNSFVMDRRAFYVWDTGEKKWQFTLGTLVDPALQTQLFIYFNSMMVSVYEERFNYDWNLFISDLGGSVGFLLGLSVVGLLKILGKTWEHFLRPYIKCVRKGKAASIGSTVTVDVATVEYPDIMRDDRWRNAK